MNKISTSNDFQINFQMWKNSNAKEKLRSKPKNIIYFLRMKGKKKTKKKN